MATDKLIAGRNAKYFMAPYSSGVTVLPANTVLWGTGWGGSWVDVGYTQDGLTLTIETETGEIFVDQVEDAMRRPVTGRTIMVETNLAENTLANMQRAVGYGAIATNAAGSGTRGDDTLTITAGSKPTIYAFGADIQDDESTEAVRFVIYRGQATGSVASTFGMSDANAQVPLQITALPDPTTSPARLLAVRHVIAALP